MSERFTIELSEHTAQIVRALAERTGRGTAAILSDMIDQSVAEIPVASLPDAEVLALADMMMNEAEGEELNDLLDDQREEALDQVKRDRLDELLQAYRRGMVRKSEALRVAVERGLRPSLG